MAKSFDEILEAMLEAYQQNPNITEEELVRLAIPDADEAAQQTAIAEAQEAGELLQQFHNNAVSLAEAREEGRSRAYWMEREIESATPDWTDEQKSQLISNINQAVEENINKTISEEE